MSYVVPSILATPPDYTAWTQTVDAPADILSILRACSALVIAATRTSVYDTDPATGIATDTIVSDALRDATCIQAAAWVSLGISGSGGVAQPSNAIKRKKLLTGEIEYSDLELKRVQSARAAATSSLVPEARQHLNARGLISAAVGSW